MSCFAEGQIQGLKQFDRWDNGKTKVCTMYDAKGFLKAKAYCRYDGTVEKVERFDIHGNKTEEVLYDQKGKLKSGIDGWAARRWWYEGSRLISQISYGEDGRPIERLMYDDSGRLVQRMYSDEKSFNPYEEASMFMLLGGRNMSYHDPRPKREGATEYEQN